LIISVRDASARLPNGEGTRGDICELLKDSQFLAPGVSDAQVNIVGFISFLEKLFTVFTLFFSLTCQTAKFFLFIQTISLTIFTCPNPVLLVPGFWQVG
jgi:hypothetical protein